MKSRSVLEVGGPCLNNITENTIGSDLTEWFKFEWITMDLQEAVICDKSQLYYVEANASVYFTALLKTN